MHWTDERMDDLARHVDRGFDKLDGRIDKLGERIDDVDAKFERKFDKLDSKIEALDTKFDRKFDRMQYMLMGSSVGIVVSLIGANAAGLFGG